MVTDDMLCQKMLWYAVIDDGNGEGIGTLIFLYKNIKG